MDMFKNAIPEHIDPRYYLDNLYQYTRDLVLDHQKAYSLEWYQKAAEQSFAKSQYKLGQMYREGEVVPQDDKKALTWLQKAAEQGHAEAQFDLAYLYHNGQVVSQNYAEAHKWYQKAAEQGHPIAQGALGFFYEHGYGGSQNLEKAYLWYTIAVSNGFKEVIKWQKQLSTLLNTQQIAQVKIQAEQWLAEHD
ncbi:MAG: sel1 repeat family protein [SAR324 cluster bacterium]|nr:sel1 repeat family protein [SAR324 cluster bacterium]